jgi:uncharacterized protein (TIGR03643 family)
MPKVLVMKKKALSGFDHLSERDLDRIIEMAWEDHTPFDAIQAQFGLTNAEVIKLMRANLKTQSFNRWRKRTDGRKTKHSVQSDVLFRFKSRMQRTITGNRISKR